MFSELFAIIPSDGKHVICNRLEQLDLGVADQFSCAAINFPQQGQTRFSFRQSNNCPVMSLALVSPRNGSHSMAARHNPSTETRDGRPRSRGREDTRNLRESPARYNEAPADRGKSVGSRVTSAASRPPSRRPACTRRHPRRVAHRRWRSPTPEGKRGERCGPSSPNRSSPVHPTACGSRRGHR